MRLINVLADRVLGVMVPKATAGACVPPDPWTVSCGCSGGIIRKKTCHYNCGGDAQCGACNATTIHC